MDQLHVSWFCIAWQWRWSLTWRWIFRISLHDGGCLLGFHCVRTHCGESFMAGLNTPLFDVWLTTQPNMARK